MERGKLQGKIMDRSIFQILQKNSKGMYTLETGRGYQLIPLSRDQRLAVTVNQIEGTLQQVGILTVPRALNSLLITGADPIGILLSVTLPEDEEEKQLRAMMRKIETACQEEKIEILGGDTRVSSHVSAVQMSVTALGLLEGAEENFPQKAHAGQDIVMTKWAGLSGSWLLEQTVQEAFQKRYPKEFSQTIENYQSQFSVRPELAEAWSKGERALFDLSNGGVYGGLWEMASAGNVGLRVDLKKIPIRQETVELCNYVDVNPYQIASMGSLLIASDQGEHLVSHLAQRGIAAQVIGCFCEGPDRVIENGDERGYLYPPKGDAIPGKLHTNRS